MASSDKIYCFSPEMVQLVESTDRRCAQSVRSRLSDAQIRERGMRIWERDGAHILVETKQTGERAGRVSGFGWESTPDRAAFDRIITDLRDEAVDTIHFSILPGPKVSEIIGWLKGAGFARRQRSVHWIRATETVQTASDSPYDIRRVTKRVDLEEFARIVAINYHYKPGADLTRQLEEFSSPHTACFLACIDGEPVGTGSMILVENSCALGYGTTLSPYRKRGVQNAMIAARLRYAKEAGCGWATASTMGYDRSSRNIVRQGFTKAYESLPFTWRRSAV